MADAHYQQQLQRLQDMEQHMNRLSDELQALENKSAELAGIQEALTDLEKKPEGTELLVPLSNGIFVKAKLLDAKQLLVNVGKGTVVPKSNADAKKMVADQQAEIDKYKTQVMMQMQAIDEKAYEIEAAIKQ